jgi:hypothetical protein
METWEFESLHADAMPGGVTAGHLTLNRIQAGQPLSPWWYTKSMAYKNKEDQLAAQRRHYAANKQDYIDRKNAKREQLREVMRNAKDKPCADCGKSYPYYVMQFDHLPDFEKTTEVAKLVHRGSLKLLLEEIAKCEVVCANCHMIRTHNRMMLASTTGSCV